eukprot:TRINITY_DN349_c0_g1_i1.p1 TRINITY_DN349_c0_g1~~TRINITY_DN349_c0_g1_i1.p1  ORF type:complete len:383 (-),score=57.44 TRINITY_DN349_c0_g1_i1:250-1398(-)
MIETSEVERPSLPMHTANSPLVLFKQHQSSAYYDMYSYRQGSAHTQQHVGEQSLPLPSLSQFTLPPLRISQLSTPQALPSLSSLEIPFPTIKQELLSARSAPSFAYAPVLQIEPKKSKSPSSVHHTTPSDPASPLMHTSRVTVSRFHPYSQTVQSQYQPQQEPSLPKEQAHSKEQKEPRIHLKLQFLLEPQQQFPTGSPIPTLLFFCFNCKAKLQYSQLVQHIEDKHSSLTSLIPSSPELLISRPELLYQLQLVGIVMLVTSSQSFNKQIQQGGKRKYKIKPVWKCCVGCSKEDSRAFSSAVSVSFRQANPSGLQHHLFSKQHKARLGSDRLCFLSSFEEIKKLECRENGEEGLRWWAEVCEKFPASDQYLGALLYFNLSEK